MGNHRQAMAGVMGFLTFEKFEMTQKQEHRVHIKVLYILEIQF